MVCKTLNESKTMEICLEMGYGSISVSSDCAKGLWGSFTSSVSHSLEALRSPSLPRTVIWRWLSCSWTEAPTRMLRMRSVSTDNLTCPPVDICLQFLCMSALLLPTVLVDNIIIIRRVDGG